MDGRIEASRNLLLGLNALEGGAIDREQFVSAVRDWNGSPDRSMSGGPRRARWTGMRGRSPGWEANQVARDLELPGDDEPEPTRRP